MEPRAELFFIKTMPPAFKHYQAKLLIYSCVARGVDNHIYSKKLHKRRAAQNAVLIVKDLTTQRLSELVEDDGIFADYVIYYEVFRLRRDHNVALISQDQDLSYDVLGIKNIRSSRYNTDIQAFRINNSGGLMSWTNSLTLIDEVKSMDDTAKCRQMLPRNMVVVPASCSNKAIQISKTLPPQKNLHTVNRANQEALEEKHKAEAEVFFQQTLITTPGSVSQKSTKERRLESSNFLERFLRTVSGTFSHQGPRIGGRR